MSSVNRTLEGEVLVHHLPKAEQMIDQSLLARTGRTARTLVKEGVLRLTLLAMAADGDLPPHSTEGPVTIHLLEGEVVFSAAGEKYALGVGDVLVIASGVEHSARSKAGCRFLLTVIHPPSAGTRLEDMVS